MSTRRKFTFPLATLTYSAGRLHDALGNDDYQAPMAERLGAPFAAAFEAEITAVTGKSAEQSGKTGDFGDLTKEQREAFQEMERLTNGARRSARLAFPGHDVILRSEFQVGVDEPKTLAAELDRAGQIHTATGKYAAQLQAKGWLPRDTTALGTAIETLAGKDTEQEETLDERLGLTDEKVTAANTLYASCLAVQNAARLEYPAKKDAQGNQLHVTARARFLLDEFPPRDRSQPDGGTQGTTTPPPTP